MERILQENKLFEIDSFLIRENEIEIGFSPLLFIVIVRKAITYNDELFYTVTVSHVCYPIMVWYYFLRKGKSASHFSEYQSRAAEQILQQPMPASRLQTHISSKDWHHSFGPPV